MNCLSAASYALPNVVSASMNTMHHASSSSSGSSTSAPGLFEQLATEINHLTADGGLLSNNIKSSSTTEITAMQKKASATSLKNDYLSFSSNGATTNSKSNNKAEQNSDANTVANTIELSEEYWETLSQLFSTCETVLLHCGATLSAAVRERLSVVVNQGLSCLSLGLLPPQYTDRHMHRSAGARLRREPRAQRLLLQLATTEVFCPAQQHPQLQQYSRNLPLLRQVAGMCMRCTATAADASRALLMISALLMPVTVPLPAVPTIDIARDYILTATNQQHDAALFLKRSVDNEVEGVDTVNNNSQLLQSSFSDDQNTLLISQQIETSVSLVSSVLSTNENTCEDNNDNNQNDDDDDEEKDRPNKKARLAAQKEISIASGSGRNSMPQLQQQLAPQLFKQQTKPIDTKNSSNTIKEDVENSDDDESLPDIDIEADPDSE